MTFEQSAKNYHLDYTLGNLTFSYPVRREVSGALFVLTIMWLGILALFVAVLFSENFAWDESVIILLVFAAIFAYRVYPILTLVIKQALVKESIQATYSFLRVTRTILGMQFSKEYQNELVDRLDAIQPRIKRFEILRFGLASVDVQVNGSINLLYNGKNINLGFPLDQSEGREVVAAIYKNFPHYKKSTSLFRGIYAP